MGRVIGSILFVFAGLIAIRGMVRAVMPDSAADASSISQTSAAESFINSDELLAQAETATPTGVQGAGRGLQRQDEANSQVPDTGSAGSGSGSGSGVDPTTGGSPTAPSEPLGDSEETPTNPPVPALW